MKFKTIGEATRHWVNGFNAIDQNIIERLARYNIDDIHEVTKIREGSQVYYCGEVMTVESIDFENNTAILSHYSDDNIEADLDYIDLEFDSFLPMWGTMWSFGEFIDEEWLTDDDGLQLMSDCGFRIFYDEESNTHYFGVDGAGYDFYEAHWIPLYKARGLMWHEEKEELAG